MSVKLPIDEIPVIDFFLFSHGNKQAKQMVVKEIHDACSQVGFIYLQNHGMSEDLIEKVFIQSKSFFDLPLKTKQQFAWSDEFSNQGYVGIERERLNPNRPGDLKEAFNLVESRNRVNESSIPESQNTPIHNGYILNFYEACNQLANKVLQALALALELPENFFVDNHSNRKHTLRLLHYPPLEQKPQIGQIRAGEHSDYGSITLLFQDSLGGLEVKTSSSGSNGDFGKWICAPSIPNTVIVNTGDLIQRWTNHVFCSTKHRVIIPDDNRVTQSRYSLAFFCHPNDDTTVTCLESCKKEHPPIYPPILAGDYLLSRLRATY
nr:2-oxoglutarate and iron-dependent oxygenase domain-containing protein [Mastigocoleus testarum]